MRLLTPSHTNGHLYLVAVAEKSLRVANLSLEIVRVDTAGKLDLLDLNHLLILLGFLHTLCLFKTVFTIIHDLANRGFC